jgi:hypothetical protein
MGARIAMLRGDTYCGTADELIEGGVSSVRYLVYLLRRRHAG